MKGFIGEDFLLTTEAARRLYHEHAEKMPIFDYHCHLNPAEIYENKQFSDIGEAWLAGDHYKWRVMRANAVSSSAFSGSTSCSAARPRTWSGRPQTPSCKVRQAQRAH